MTLSLLKKQKGIWVFKLNKELLKIKLEVLNDVRNVRLSQPRDCDPEILSHYLDWRLGLALEEAYEQKELKCKK